MIICPQCQKENRHQAHFCAYCGSSFTDKAADQALLADTLAEGAAWTPSEEVHRVAAGVEQHPDAPIPVPAAAVEAVSEGEPVAMLAMEPEQEAEAQPDQTQSAAIDEALLIVVSQPSTDASEEASGWEALAPGTTIADRFVIIQMLNYTDGICDYEGRDLLRCAACGSDTMQSDKFCSYCGAEQQEGAIVCLQESYTAPDGEVAIPFEGRWYKVSAGMSQSAAAPLRSTGWRFQVGQASDTGLLREIDEDSVFSLVMSGVYQSEIETTLGLFILADGMGGQASGEVASKLAVQTVAQSLLQRVIWPMLQGETLLQETLQGCIIDAVKLANKTIYDLRCRQGNDMGTTLTMALAINDQVLVGNVGDSRTYVWSTDGLQQLTEDHSLIALLIASGEEPEDAIYTHPQRNFITRNLGDRPDIEVDVFSLQLESGFRLLLCCDGVWEMIRKEGIEEALSRDTDPQRVADSIVHASNAAGGEDNISVLVVAAEQTQEVSQ